MENNKSKQFSASTISTTDQSQQSSDEQKFKNKFAPEAIILDVLKETNYYRRMHHAQPLELNEDLCTYAQEWANFLAKTKQLETRPERRFGESILRAIKENFSVPRMIKLWYQEKYQYNFDDPKFDLYTGHFTQLVWFATKSLGVGVASDHERIWIVCNYMPPGNISDQYKTNVYPRKIMLSSSESEDDKEIQPPIKQKSRNDKKSHMIIVEGRPRRENNRFIVTL